MDHKTDPNARMRLDKWLWAARFFKTRSIAVEAIDKGRVLVGGQHAKRSRDLHVGDVLSVRQGSGTELPRVVVVKGLSEVRGPAPVAQTLYEETAESVAAREAAADRGRFAAEPAQSIEQGRPTKRDRRQLAEWDRWSASHDE